MPARKPKPRICRSCPRNISALPKSVVRCEGCHQRLERWLAGGPVDDPKTYNPRRNGAYFDDPQE